MSPVDSCGTAKRLAILVACVPLYGLPSSGFQNDLFFLLSSSVSLFDLEIPFLRPDPAVLQSRRAQEAVKVGRRTNLSTYSGPCQAMP